MKHISFNINDIQRHNCKAYTFAVGLCDKTWYESRKVYVDVDAVQNCQFPPDLESEAMNFLLNNIEDEYISFTTCIYCEDMIN